ncbi:hypothetical protein [Dactylosporangium sp. CS-033363]|uniref:hypothetical protein n=1 Tax=Dactylosporangium sp. CS-033363 TaxID=3239935 RepID=UPI003D93E6A5
MLTVKNKIGLVLAAVFGLLDLAGPILMGGRPAASDEVGPPMAVLVADAVLGLATLFAVVVTWRTANRTAARVVAATRILSALSAVPGLFATGVAPAVVALVSGVVILTAVTVILVLSRSAPAEQPA